MALPGYLNDQTLLFANAQQINIKPCTQNLINDLSQLIDGYPQSPMLGTWWDKRQACIVQLLHGGRKRRKPKRRKKRRKRTYRRRRASKVRKARRTRRRIRRRRRRRGGTDVCNAGYTGTLNRVGQLNCQELSQEPQA